MNKLWEKKERKKESMLEENKSTSEALIKLLIEKYEK